MPFLKRIQVIIDSKALSSLFPRVITRYAHEKWLSRATGSDVRRPSYAHRVLREYRIGIPCDTVQEERVTRMTHSFRERFDS